MECSDRRSFRFAKSTLAFCVVALARVAVGETDACRPNDTRLCAKDLPGSVDNAVTLTVNNQDVEVARNLKLAAADLKPAFVTALRIEPRSQEDLLPSAERTFTVRLDISERAAAGTSGGIALEVWSEDGEGKLIPFARGAFEIALPVSVPVAKVRMEVEKKKTATEEGERKQVRP
jgi:hypothetical protein